MSKSASRPAGAKADTFRNAYQVQNAPRSWRGTLLPGDEKQRSFYDATQSRASIGLRVLADKSELEVARRLAERVTKELPITLRKEGVAVRAQWQPIPGLSSTQKVKLDGGWTESVQTGKGFIEIGCRGFYPAYKGLLIMAIDEVAQSLKAAGTARK